MTIQAGTGDQIKWNCGSWIFVDLGFAQAKNPSCGVLIGDEEPREVCFSKACDLVRKHVGSIDDDPINLVLEAPLSIAFDHAGNPKGRSIEKRKGKQPKYWYLQAGIVVMVAAQHMIDRIKPATEGKKLLLFEGFISFKQEKSSHCDDVLALRDIVRNPDASSSCIVSKDMLVMEQTDKLVSAFDIQGCDYGVPPVLTPGSSGEAT